MQFTLETLACLATIAGLFVSILGLYQSRAWLVLTSVIVICLAIVAVLYARRQRMTVAAASTVLEGQSIDSLNIANLKRRVNRTFFIQEAQHTARIDGWDMEVSWKYSGYCKAPTASAMEFSVDSEAGTTFDKLHCVAYDLRHDPEMTLEIRPLLIGSDGISKKISAPFLEPLKAQEPFEMLLKCTLRGCLRPHGSGYYTSTLSFAQQRISRYEVRLVFAGLAPNWVRVYDCTRHPAVLLKSLAPSRQGPGLCEYLDVIEDSKAQSARVYMFWRDSV